MGVLSSTRTAVVLLVLIAAAAVVGTVLKDETAQKYVYGRAWFHLLLMLLGLNLLACMFWRRRIGLARAWSLLTHGGLFLVLVGAVVTLVWSERGSMTIYEGHAHAECLLQGAVNGRATYEASTRTLADPEAHFFSRPEVGFFTRGVRPGYFVLFMRREWKVASVTSDTEVQLEKGPASDIEKRIPYQIVRPPKPLGFTVKLVDFRITRYPPVDYLRMSRREGPTRRLRIAEGKPTALPAAGWSATAKLLPEGRKAFVEVSFADGAQRDVPAEVGKTEGLGPGQKTAIEVLRYVPALKIDNKTKKVTNYADEPLNPALQVRLVREGKAEGAQWLFARFPEFSSGGRHQMSVGKRRDDAVRFRYAHPAFPEPAAVLRGPAGAGPLRIWSGGAAHAPWDPGVILTYAREAAIKEYESEVEVLEREKVVKRHVIRVNSPLVHRGTKLSQMSYDQENERYTVLGFSRDKGVWFVYAGFIAMTIGLMGKFYVTPVLRSRRRGKQTPRQVSSPEESDTPQGTI